MTHTLHRLKSDLIGKTESHSGNEEPPADYIIMTMACQGHNDRGAADKLRRAFAVLADHDPVNIANGEEGIYTGSSLEQLSSGMKDTSYVAAVFDDPDSLVEALLSLKREDIGLSVVVTGNPGQTWRLIERAGLHPHTVNLSLGVFGDEKMLPAPDIQGLIMMCGHGLITPRLAEKICENVRAGRMAPEEGARQMAGLCTCGIFNTRIGEAILRGQLEGKDT